MSPPETANAIAVPAGHELVMTVSARGTVNYECRARAGMAGAYMWTVDAPDAVLRHWSGWPVGRLYAGPTWAHRDGSRLTGQLVGAVSAGPGRLPDQLWHVVPSGDRGEFSDIAYVGRRNASGGAPPTTACGEPQVGRGAKADYVADYAFYRRRATPP